MVKKVVYISLRPLLKKLGFVLFLSLFQFDFAVAETEKPTQDTGPAMQRLNEYLQALHPWESSTRGFRREHNITLGLARSASLWEVSSNGQDFGSFEDSQYLLTLGYEFHLQLIGGVGYLLGSRGGIGLKKEQSTTIIGPLEDTEIGLRFFLPGVTSGFVLNINPLWRIGIVFDLFLERIEGFKSTNSEFGTHSATGRVWGWGANLDWFYKLNWGIRLDYQVRTGWYHKSHLNYDRWDQMVRIGTIYHLI